MLNCREATRLMSANQERRLGLVQRLRLRAHWAICEACRNFGRQMDVLQRAMQRYARLDDRELPPRADDEDPGGR